MARGVRSPHDPQPRALRLTIRHISEPVRPVDEGRNRRGAENAEETPRSPLRLLRGLCASAVKEVINGEALRRGRE